MYARTSCRSLSIAAQSGFVRAAGRRWNHTPIANDGSYDPGIPPPLSHIRILDLTRVLAGPTATMLLADLGADVIKVEETTRGDGARSWYPPAAPLRDVLPKGTEHLPPESAYFLVANRNKRSITVNLKSPGGKEVIKRLVQRSDVLVENFISGKLAEMGLGYGDCKQWNEKLIYASISGYGQTGPFRKNAGYDVVIEGEAGLMHITGEPDRPPSKVGVAVTDIATGLYTHGAIMAALISRDKTGVGCWIDCNLFETQIAGLANVASSYLVGGQEGSRHGTSHPSIVPYQAFRCKDGYIMIGSGNDRQFQTLAEKVLLIPSLQTDPKFATNQARVENRAELIQIIEDALMREPRDVWLKRFEGKGIPHGPINNIAETFKHPQAIARQVTVDVEHPRIATPVRLVRPAVSYNGKKMPVRIPPPYLGQHTNEVLQELGFVQEEIVEMKNRGDI
ncbi:CAIB/BAIF family enzyme [Fistulina hepatica ATCC 64428]|uniref:CAIB/BAIF family enzyme n=1 Tax=Fistulina hepatica ATCC 64428 TaxID=1128425 RepID=A0A0D7A487_9AGAR|nr:CAIB/BAIF family enzyme [Fistulina hepatica ATCC 64428]